MKGEWPTFITPFRLRHCFLPASTKYGTLPFCFWTQAPTQTRQEETSKEIMLMGKCARHYAWLHTTAPRKFAGNFSLVGLAKILIPQVACMKYTSYLSFTASLLNDKCLWEMVLMHLICQAQHREIVLWTWQKTLLYWHF